MQFEDIPTTKEDFKKKEKEWIGFDRALYKIGLNKEEVLDRIKRGLLPYKSKEEQRRKCDEVYRKAIRTRRKREVSPPPRIMTAARQRPKDQMTNRKRKKDVEQKRRQHPLNQKRPKKSHISQRRKK